MNTFREKVRGFIGVIKNGKSWSVLVILVLVAAIPATVLIAQQEQETRQRASENQATITVSPASVEAGQTVNVAWTMTQPSQNSGSGNAGVGVSPTSVARGANITLEWRYKDGLSPQSTDYLEIFVAKDSQHVGSLYMSSNCGPNPGNSTVSEGSCIFNTQPLGPSTYTVKVMRNGNPLGSQASFTVSGENPSDNTASPRSGFLLIQKAYAQTTLTGGETLQLTPAGSNSQSGAARMYLNCISISDINNHTTLPTSPILSGQCAFPIPANTPAGSYVIRMLATDGSTILGSSAPLTVTAAATPQISLTMTPQQVAYDGSLTLNWTTSSMPASTTCTQSWDFTSGITINTSGSKVIANQRVPHTFTITCSNGKTASVTSQITAPPVPGSPPLDPAVFNLSDNPTSIPVGFQTFTWNKASGANHFTIKIDDHNNDFFPATCDGSNNSASDVCITNFTGGEYSFNFIKDHSYTIQVFQHNAAGDQLGGPISVGLVSQAPGPFTLSGITFCSGTNSHIRLNWTKPTNGPRPGINSGYFIHINGGEGMNILHVFTFDDPTPKTPGQTYNYRVEAVVIPDGRTFSNEVSVVAENCSPTAPTATPTTAPTAVPPTATPLPTATPIPTFRFTETAFLTGIGAPSGTFAPKHLTRNTSIILFNAANTPVATQEGTITYTAASGTFDGLTFISQTPPTIAAGNYIVKLQTPQFLRKAVPGILSIQPNTTITLPTLRLTTGDINLDNRINILDYNIMMSCFDTRISSAECLTTPQFSLNGAPTEPMAPLADLNDDGVVDEIDYNLFIRSLSTVEGD